MGLFSFIKSLFAGKSEEEIEQSAMGFNQQASNETTLSPHDQSLPQNNDSNVEKKIVEQNQQQLINNQAAAQTNPSPPVVPESSVEPVAQQQQVVPGADISSEVQGNTAGDSSLNPPSQELANSAEISSSSPSPATAQEPVGMSGAVSAPVAEEEKTENDSENNPGGQQG